MTSGVAHGRRATRLTLASLAAVVAAGLVAGATVFSLQAAVSPATVVPVTLANGANCSGGCSTTLNAAATSATTGTGTLSPISDREWVKLVHGTSAWTVKVRALGITGSLVSDGIVLSVASTATSSITLNAASTFPLLSGSVPLAGGGGATDVSVNARGLCLGTCVMTLELLITSGSASYTYPITLTVT